MTAPRFNLASVPAPYVAGTITLEPNTSYDLLELIQKHLEIDCPGASVEFLLSADPTNMAPIWVGAVSRIGGKLTVKNSAYNLTPMAPPRLYRSSYPGSSTAIGRLQVLSEAPAKLHVEVQE